MRWNPTTVVALLGLVLLGPAGAAANDDLYGYGWADDFQRQQREQQDERERRAERQRQRAAEERQRAHERRLRENPLGGGLPKCTSFKHAGCQ